MPPVFISYSRDPDPHRLRVGDLASRLSECGVDLIIDRDTHPAGPPEGWALWSEKQIEAAAFVLVVCNESYRRSYYSTDPNMMKGHGAAWEAHIIRSILGRAPADNDKIRAVIFDRADRAHIPASLANYQFFSLGDPGGYEALLAWLGQSESRSPPPLGVSADIAWPLPSEYNWPLADRKDEFEFFRKVLSGQLSQRLMFLRGKPSSGKTTVLEKFRAYARHRNIPISVVDCKGCPELEDVFETLRVDLDPDCELPAFAGDVVVRRHQIVADLQRLTSPVLLMFDTYHQASTATHYWIEHMLFPRLERAPAVVVVVAGQKVPQYLKRPWRSLVECRTLRPIDKVGDWLDYLERKWGSAGVSEEDLCLLTQAAAGEPAMMITLLTNLRRAAKPSRS